jgi:hypothetical protein
MSNIIGTCVKCGYALDVLLIGRCPNCRLQAVAKAFAPVDALRTALGIPGLVEDAELDGVWHWHGEPYEIYSRYYQPEVPRECKVPQGKEAQVYELKRRFRL